MTSTGVAHLPATQQTVLEAIDGLGLEISTGSRLSSVTAVLRGGRPGPAVLLRGDMDALPVTEATEVGYASKIPGDLVFMFQPGEEGWDGAGRGRHHRRQPARRDPVQHHSRRGHHPYVLGRRAGARTEAPALCRQVGGAYGLEVDVRYKHEYPVTVNDARHAEFAAGVVGDRFDGPDNHSPRAAFDDAVLPDGALLHAQLAVRAPRRDAAELS